MARKPGVVFSYGQYIYAPPGAVLPLSPHLVIHEAVHGERQLAIGVELWWRHYLENLQFRYDEELLAHRAEYQSMVKHGFPAQNALKGVAGRLASPLYSCGYSLSKIMGDITK